MLMGEYHHNLDEKGRITIPSRLRDELGNDVIITRGLDNCLFVYSVLQWQAVVSKLEGLPFTKKDARNFNRIFLSGATVCCFDKQGRINISLPLISYADLKKECVIIGVNDRLEVWDKDKWNSFIENGKESFAQIADSLFDFEVKE